MSTSFLFNPGQKELCCGCGACIASCPSNAIKMKPDALGFLYPTINDEMCVNCHLCNNICNFTKSESNTSSSDAYVATSKNAHTLMASSSGGIFTELATKIIDEGGIVFGAEMKKLNGTIILEHVGITSKQELFRISGSKYIQSSIQRSYQTIKQELQLGKKVLFCGTPCQVDGLYSQLKKGYDNLYTVDIVCHGVPSLQIFNDYINYLEKKYKANQVDLLFREKKEFGWSHGAIAVIKCDNGTIKKRKIPYKLSSFYSTFMNSQLIRDSCYECKYSSKNRPGDITLGDYWGIHREHPELLKSNGGILDVEKGVSCVLVNSEKGRALFASCNDTIVSFKSTFDKMARNNPALVSPPKKDKTREYYINAYKKYGYAGIEKEFKKQYGTKLIWIKIKCLIPQRLKRKLLRRL